MTHLSGGAVSGIVFGCLLAFLGSISLLMWWRRVHRDLYSNDPNVWGGSWGVKAQRELQARIDRQNAERWAMEEQQRAVMRAEERAAQETWKDVEAQAGRASDEGTVARDSERTIGEHDGHNTISSVQAAHVKSDPS